MSSSPYRVSIRSEDAQRGKISQRWVRDVVRRALAADRAQDGSRVEVLIAGDETVSALNIEFLGQDGTTDVLSFPSEIADSDDDDWPDSGDDSGGDLGQIVLFRASDSPTSRRCWHEPGRRGCAPSGTCGPCTCWAMTMSSVTMRRR